METVHITKNIFPGVALGQTSMGNIFYIMNGDLYLDKSCDVLINEKTATLKELNYDITHFIEKYGDKDSLISTQYLQEIKQSKPFDRIFEIENKWCFPSYSIKRLTEIAISNDLWNAARISISKTRFRVISRATIFGVDFQRAIFKAVKEGISVTHLYCPNYKDWTHLGVFADFLIKVTKTKEGLIEFNSWQAIGEEENLFFVHGIINDKLTYFIHIDFAYHHCSLEEIQKLLSNGKEKPILTFKEKIFRIDGQIEIDLGFELMRIFFPIDRLVDEYYHRV